MTISSSLNSGVAGLTVNASRLATIADNIANAGTYGYKRAVADFHSMVVMQSDGSYSAGGVRATVSRMIDQRGTLVSTTNPTDIAIGGRGLLPVTSAAALNDDGDDLPIMLTSTGSFRPDAEGILRTETGEVLMGWPANADGSIPAYPRDTFAGLEPIMLNTNQFIGDPTTRMELSVNLPATSTEAGAGGDTLVMSAEYYDNLGTSQFLEIEFTPTVPATGSSHEWTMVVRDSASDGAVIGEYTVTFDDARGNGGNLDTVTPISGGPFDPVTGTLALTVDGGPMELVIGVPGEAGGLTQLSDTFSRAPVVKDGSPVGDLTTVEVDANGLLHAIYDNGMTRVIYQIPVVDVPNMNGLMAHDNQTYSITADSGAAFLWDAGDGPTGEMVGYAREESATDVAAELTQLIQTQRAYSSNAKIIQTVDEMLQETTNMKR
ncbi:flagellar hook-basal body complex protein [Roseibacterium beibuensis]|uniref:Flagellar hook protein FlgE n=1 Tax=[Roseibacterium] beibuensis TaxID=1193142 RepID=A0ABP9LET1_9RHOB|nr:flagellar hook-basal body complex protein [Roseibacterium beibuensis]MCS6626564.1 flagellar hook-basal body complex protein [Roseibacterium beibuensis]